MPSVLGEEIAWEEVNILATRVTCLRFDPKKVFYVSI
jgi:hypothetical protein